MLFDGTHHTHCTVVIDRDHRRGKCLISLKECLEPLITALDRIIGIDHIALTVGQTVLSQQTAVADTLIVSGFHLLDSADQCNAPVT